VLNTEKRPEQLGSNRFYVQSPRGSFSFSLFLMPFSGVGFSLYLWIL